MIKRLIPFIALLLWHLPAWTQTIVNGTVRDQEGESLIGVTIRLKEQTSIGTISNDDGSFSMEVPDAAGTLLFSYVGYTDQEVSFLPGKTTLTVVLQSDVELEEVIVVGYGTQKKSDVTGAISSVSNKDFKDQPVGNIAGSIQGKVSGLNVTNPSGTPGSSLLVSVRGQSNPLYVVDGIPLLSESNSAIATSFDTQGNVTGNGQSISSLSDINPNDIESIEILKDASSAAIYGARAANGVILITTKRGAAGKTQFGLNYYTGFQQVANPINFLSADEMVALVEEARSNDLKAYEADPESFGPDFDPALLTNPLPETWYTDVNTNWLDEIFRTAPVNNLEFSARGGNEKTKFYSGISYFDQQGIVIESYYRRFNARLNVDHQVNEHFSFGENLTLTYSRNRRSFNDDVYTGVVTNALGASPFMPVYNEDGSYAGFEDYQVSWLSDNPVKSAHEVQGYTSSYRALGTLYGEWRIMKNLKFRSSWSVDYTNLSDDLYFSPITVDAENVGGKATNGTYNQTVWLGENIFSYDYDIDKDNHLSAVGGFTLQQSDSRRQSVSGQGFPIGSNLTNVSSAATITGGVDEGSNWALVSFLGRVNYDYKGRYLLSLSARTDGSSRFSPSNQYAFFPAVSAGWRLSDENFWPRNNTLTDLKIRASYGLTGDQEIGDFQYISFWTPVTYNGQSGLNPRNIADPDLKWQTNKMLNLGIDYEFMGGRIYGAVEFYKSNKTDLLSEDVIPGTTGYESITRNYGNILNRGFEFSVNAVPVDGAVKWDLGINFSTLHNEIIDLSTDGVLVNAYNDLAPTHILQEGQAYGTFWGVKYLGVDPETGDPQYEDINGDGIIDGDDSQIIGKATPDMYGGFNTTLTWKNWDLGIAASFSVGNDVYNLIRGEYESLGWSDEGWDENLVLYQVYTNNSTEVDDRWKQPGDQADIPRASLVYQQVLQNSSQTLEDASYFRIRTINLGYTFKPRQNHDYNSLYVYAQVQNPLLITGYSGFDPEVSSTGGDHPETAGVDYAAYPQARTFTVGFNFNF